MPKYNVTIGFDLSTEIEPEVGRYSFDHSEVEDWEDSTYWSTEAITATGGEVTFTLVAEHEEAAEEKAFEIVYDGMEVMDDNSIAWSAENVSVEVELVEVPMDVARASEILTRFLATAILNEETKEALRFLLGFITERNEAVACDCDEHRHGEQGLNCPNPAGVPALPVTHSNPGARS